CSRPPSGSRTTSTRTAVYGGAAPSAPPTTTRLTSSRSAMSLGEPPLQTLARESVRVCADSEPRVRRGQPARLRRRSLLDQHAVHLAVVLDRRSDVARREVGALSASRVISRAARKFTSTSGSSPWAATGSFGAKPRA